MGSSLQRRLHVNDEYSVMDHLGSHCPTRVGRRGVANLDRAHGLGCQEWEFHAGLRRYLDATEVEKDPLQTGPRMHSHANGTEKEVGSSLRRRLHVNDVANVAEPS